MRNLASVSLFKSLLFPLAVRIPVSETKTSCVFSFARKAITLLPFSQNLVTGLASGTRTELLYQYCQVKKGLPLRSQSPSRTRGHQQQSSPTEAQPLQGERNRFPSGVDRPQARHRPAHLQRLQLLPDMEEARGATLGKESFQRRLRNCCLGPRPQSPLVIQQAAPVKLLPNPQGGREAHRECWD